MQLLGVTLCCCAENTPGSKTRALTAIVTLQQHYGAAVESSILTGSVPKASTSKSFPPSVKSD